MLVKKPYFCERTFVFDKNNFACKYLIVKYLCFS